MEIGSSSQTKMIKLKKPKIGSIFAQNPKQFLPPATITTTSTSAAVTATVSIDKVKPVNTGQQSHLFKLDIDCMAKIFDYLSLKELINCAQTCKLMQAVCGHIFQLYYPYANAIVDDDHIFVDMDGSRYNIDIFTEYVKCVMFTNLACDRTAIQWHRFKSVVHANFYYARFNAQQIRLVGNILLQAKSIILSNCQFDGDELFHEFFAKCHRTRRLIIGMVYNCGLNWLHEKYPMLQHVGIWPILRSPGELRGMQDFLHQNSQISTFVFSLKFIFANKRSIMTMKVKDLHVVLDDEHFQEFCELLRELYENGVYQRLSMKFFEYFEVTQQIMDQLPTINGLIGFRVPFNAHDIDLNSLVNLETLEFACNINQVKNVPSLAQNLTQLRSIHFHKASIDDILPFLRQLPKLKKISVEKITNSNDDQWIDLREINEKRKQLLETTNNVSRVVIYIVEEFYLRTRLKSTTMSLRFVEMQRYEREYKLKF